MPPFRDKHFPAPTAGLVGVTARAFFFRTVSRGAMAVGAVITARQLGPSGRGVLVLILTAASFSLLVSSLGVPASGRVHLVARTRPVSLGGYLGLSSSLTVIQIVGCLTLALTLLPAVNVELTVGERALVGIVGGGLIAQYFVVSALNGYGLTGKAAFVDAAGSIGQLLLIALLAVMGARAVSPYLAAVATASIFQTGLGVAVLQRSGLDVRPHYRRQEWARLIRSGLPAIAMGLAEVLSFRLDHYLVGAFLTPAAVGIYSVAATPPELLRLLSISLGPSLFHRLAAGSSRLPDFRRARLTCFALTVLLGMVLFVLAPSVVNVLLGPQYEDAITPLRILVLGELGITLFYLDSASLGGLDRLRDAAWASVSGLVVVVLADVALIPTYGVAGAAWASVAAYSFMGLVAHLLLRRAAARGGESAPPLPS